MTSRPANVDGATAVGVAIPSRVHPRRPSACVEAPVRPRGAPGVRGSSPSRLVALERHPRDRDLARGPTAIAGPAAAAREASRTSPPTRRRGRAGRAGRAQRQPRRTRGGVLGLARAAAPGAARRVRARRPRRAASWPSRAPCSTSRPSGVRVARRSASRARRRPIEPASPVRHASARRRSWPEADRRRATTTSLRRVRASAARTSGGAAQRRRRPFRGRISRRQAPTRSGKASACAGSPRCRNGSHAVLSRREAAYAENL